MLDDRRPFRAAFLLTLLLIGGGLGAEYALAGQTGVEKMATALVMPAGLIWLLLIFTTIAAWAARWPGLATLLTLSVVLLTAAGNELVAASAVRTLEAPYANGPAEDQSVDTLIVLGGGVWETPDGRASVNDSGDRILHAARVYLAGNAKTVHCTGAVGEQLSRLTRDEGVIAKQLLLDLGVPEEAITVGPGANTSEEIRSVAEAVEAGEMAGKIGVVTSAWHMPRVERLAEASDLEIVPFPADFKSLPGSPPALEVLSAVPTSGALSLSTKVMKEYLAGVVGR